MSFNLPDSRKEVVTTMAADVKASLPTSNAFLRNSFIGSLIFAFGGRIFDVYLKLQFLLTQFFANTATGLFLERWGAIYGVTRKAATNAFGLVTFTGIDTTVIPANTQLVSQNAIDFETASDATISSSTTAIDFMNRVGDTVTVQFNQDHCLATGTVIDSITGAVPADFNDTSITIVVTSLTEFQFTKSGTSGTASTPGDAAWTIASVQINAIDAGSDGNLEGGSTTTLKTPIAGVNNNAFAEFEGIGNGQDVENDEDYRARLLQRIQEPVSFFNESAIIFQASATQGVRVDRVFVFQPSTTTSSLAVSGITRNDDVATLTTTAPHGLVDGSFITVNGAAQSDYNVVEQRIIVINATQIAYQVDNTPTTPATGAITLSFSFVEEGQVRVYFTIESDEPATDSLIGTDIIPSSQDVNLVKDNLLEIKPAHVAIDDLIVQAPVANQVDTTFLSLSPNTDEMKSAITSSITDFYRNEVVVGDDLLLVQLTSVINDVVDSSGRSPTFTLSLPPGNTAIAPGEMAVKGLITYTS